MPSFLLPQRKVAIVKLPPQEYLPDNFLDKQLQSTLNPLNLSHHSMFQAKYFIRDNFITPNGRIYNIAGLLMAVLTTIGQTSNFEYVLKQQDFTDILALAPVIQFVVCCVFTFCLLIDNTLNADANIEVILNIQAARRSYKFCDSRNKSLIITVRAFVTILTVNMVCLIIASYRFWNIATFITLYYYDVTIAYSYGVVRLLRNNLELWLVELKLRNGVILNTEKSETWSDWHEMETSFGKLSDSFYAYQRTLIVPVMVFVCIIFISALLFLQVFIESAKREIPFENVLPTIITSVLFITKNLLMLSLLSVECENLYKSVSLNHIEILCVIGKESISEEQRRTLKNVLRLQKAFTGKLTPCAMFELKAGLLLNFGHLVATYLVVLLQFAYLSH